MSGSNDGDGSSRISRFMKVASVGVGTAVVGTAFVATTVVTTAFIAITAVATKAVAGGLCAVLSSSAANSEHEVPFGARRESKERDDAEPQSFKQVNNKEDATSEKWKKPEVGWVKLNVDDLREPYNGSSAGCGGVLRDSSGKWLYGFAQKPKPTFDVHQTELLAILTGLKIALDMNIKKLVLESDNDSVVSMVKNGVKPNHCYYGVVQQIRIKLLRFEVRLVAISNKANGVANRLAKNARNLSFYVICEEYSRPPFNCVQILQKDEMGCVNSF